MSISKFCIMINDIGTILPTHGNKKCKLCKKNTAIYEHVVQSNYYMINKPLICEECLQICINFSNKFIVELAMPNIYKLYSLFKKTLIFKTLICDINYHIFYMMIQ